ncbi:MAG: DUF1648 domain-containing protein [Lachnospiraceae bacterium]|nr:DUF1648 domain-containing protein [Lachnospiraceae bacterium]
MKMKNKVLTVLTVLPLITTAIVLRFMPDKIPAHYDAAGNIDRWGSKYESFVLPGIIVIMTLFWLCFIKYFENKQKKSTNDKEVKESENNAKMLYYVADSMAIMFGVMQYFILYSAFVASKGEFTASAVDFSVVTNVCMGIMFIVLGNILPKAKKNSIVGVRTVWSMHNDRTWATSNRMGGVLLMLSGVLTILESLIIGGILSTFVMLGILVLDTILSMVYSYKMYQKYR